MTTKPERGIHSTFGYLCQRVNFKLEDEVMVEREREFFIDNLLVQIHFIIVMIRWTGLAPWESA